MDEVKRHDLKALLRALVEPIPLASALATGYLAFLGLTRLAPLSIFWWMSALLAIGAATGFILSTYQGWKKRRFLNAEYDRLWEMIEDRHRRFHRAIRRAPQAIAGGFREIARTVDDTKRRLYASIRKADLVKKEILDSEGVPRLSSLPIPPAATADKETNDLYQVAAKNFEEYQAVFEAITAKVSRTEAQCAVFISALDSLRVQLLGHRLERKDTALPKEEMDEAVHGIRTQLESINEALDELELRPGFLTGQRAALEELEQESSTGEQVDSEAPPP